MVNADLKTFHQNKKLSFLKQNKNVRDSNFTQGFLHLTTRISSAIVNICYFDLTRKVNFVFDFSNLSEAVARRCFGKKVLLELSQNLQENTCARVSFLIKL